MSVAIELLVIVLIQIIVFQLVGSRWNAYLWASLAIALITSAIVMAYVFTNHFLNPLAETTDPLATTTSVVVSPVLDLLHSNCSYYTEHHLFPHMNSDFYPEVSKILEQRYPDQYHRVPIGEAWHSLWISDQYVSYSTNATIPH